MLSTNAKLQILPQRCIVAPATRIEPADNHLAPKTSTNHLTMRPAAEERMKAMLGDDRPTPPPTCSPHAVNPTSVVLTKKDTRTCPLTTPPPSRPPLRRRCFPPQPSARSPASALARPAATRRPQCRRCRRPTSSEVPRLGWSKPTRRSVLGRRAPPQRAPLGGCTRGCRRPTK